MIMIHMVVCSMSVTAQGGLLEGDIYLFLSHLKYTAPLFTPIFVSIKCYTNSTNSYAYFVSICIYYGML